MKTTSLCIAILSSIFVTGCQGVSGQLIEALEVQPDDNGYLSLCLTLDSDTPVVDGAGRLSRLEFPLGFDTAQLNAQDLKDLLSCP